MSKSSAPTPFLKWAGGKRKLAPLLIEAFPATFDGQKHRFFEPFIGGGALTFALGDSSKDFYIPGKNLFINDMNPELIIAYQVIRDDISNLIKELNNLTLHVNEKFYYEMRASSPRSKVKRAARFIYLNKTCFNGLWRVNSKGEFNVPFGKSKNPTIFLEDNLRACSRRLKGSTITLGDFDYAVKTARKGDLVYFDPPYIPLTPSASFSQYAKENFGESDHESLQKTIQRLTKKGVYVLLSNSDTPLTRQIFKDSLTLRRVLMARSISSIGNNRKPVYEVLGMNYPHKNKTSMGELEVISQPKRG